MKTSFSKLLRQGQISAIEIPIIQRDYAQGRTDHAVTRIREAFLRVLHASVSGESNPVRLDFVYGEVKNGALVPLDGQQRLTTLFLLHWYLSARAAVSLDESAFLGSFTYKTRFSASHFCEQLIVQRPSVLAHPRDGDKLLSAWLRDQHWYAGAWDHDPTIRSMLVTLDHLNRLFHSADANACRAAWKRLLDEADPAVTFDFLSLSNLGLAGADEQYIKMNSRGKPLTKFEHFKANFEKTLNEAHAPARDEFVRKVDQQWADLLWPLRNVSPSRDQIIDDEFMRLFHFVGDVVAGLNGIDLSNTSFTHDPDVWAATIYGKLNEGTRLTAQQYLFGAFDSLAAEFQGKVNKPEDMKFWFKRFFSSRMHEPGKVAIFDDENLLGDCCAKYGGMSGKDRHFPLSRTLLLFAVLEHLRSKSRLQPLEIAHRLRTLRNLILASDNEIRLETLPAFLQETAAFMDDGLISAVRTFNARQREEESGKESLVRAYSQHVGLADELQALEDHVLLRGCLAAFDLDVDADTFIRRAKCFHQIFPSSGNPAFAAVSGALLACGDYSVKFRGEERYLFGSPSRDAVWRVLFTGAEAARLKPTLMRLLDLFALEGEGAVEDKLRKISSDFLARQDELVMFDWRYYLVKYPSMRSGSSGMYASSSRSMGFNLCMMKETQLNGTYWDAYLFAIAAQSGLQAGRDITDFSQTGYAKFDPEKRWIVPVVTGEPLISCREYGFELRVPSDAAHKALILQSFESTDVVKADKENLALRILQHQDADGKVWDGQDRILIGARLLQKFVTALTPADVVIS